MLLHRYFTHRLRAFTIAFFTGIILVSFVAVPELTSRATPNLDSNDKAATAALALVNQWRVSLGLMPLELNPTLQRMAMAQAQYILPKLDSIDPSHEELYHLDANGRNAIQRAIQVYNWPSYGAPDRVEIGENAAQFDVKGAVNFWQTSPIHAKTATNPTYREVGVVALPLKVKGTYLFYMDFGAEPGKLTALLAQDDASIYISREISKYAQVSAVTLKVQVLDDKQRPLSNENPYQLKFTIPIGVNPTLYVKYTTSTGDTWLTIDRKRDRAILPNFPVTIQDQLALVAPNQAAPSSTQPMAVLSSAEPSATDATTNNAPPKPTQVVVLSPTNAGQVIFIQPTSTPPSATIAATTPSPLSTPPTTKSVRDAVPSAATQQPDLSISWTATNLTIRNTSGKMLDLTGLSIGNATIRLAIANWSTTSQFSPPSFPAGGCLQIAQTNSGLPDSTGCRNILALIQLDSPQLFWRTSTFTVMLNNATLAECDISGYTCSVNLQTMVVG